MARIIARPLQALHPLLSCLPLPIPSPLPLRLLPQHHPLPRPSQPNSRRTYHSYEREAPPPFTPAETAILSNAFQYIPTHGFSTTALSRGAREAGYLDASINLFPTGAFALVNYHLVTQRLALAKDHPTERKEGGVAENIKALAWKRLQANTPIIHRWQEALALLALPSYLPTSFHELALLADEILFLAGDTAVDATWYTRRAALSAIYASSELFMTQDSSNGFVETHDFLSRRLDEARRASSALEMVGTWFGMQGVGFVNGLRSKGVRI